MPENGRGTPGARRLLLGHMTTLADISPNSTAQRDQALGLVAPDQRGGEASSCDDSGYARGVPF